MLEGEGKPSPDDINKRNIMTTVNKHINMIEEYLQAYKPTDDFHIPPLLILSYMNMIRAALIRQDKYNIDSSMYQIVDCLQIECLERNCSVFGYNMKIDGIKTINVPLLVSGVSPYDIKYLGGADLMSNGTKLSIDGFVNFNASRWTKNEFHYCVIGDKIYLKNLPSHNNEDMQLLTGMLLLDNPVDACNWTDESIYPCPSDYRLQVLTVQHILSAYNIYPDEYNNARQDLQKLNLSKAQQQSQEELNNE